MKYITMIIVATGFGALLYALNVQAGSMDPSRHPHTDKIEMAHDAEHTVDHAWEIYHRAALGGTVASPDLQTQIEQHLHEARTLVTQAQEAADRGDTRKVERLVGEIKLHTARAIAGSKEQKK